MMFCCSCSMLPLRFPVSAHSSHLRTGLTGHRLPIRIAVKPSPSVAVHPHFLLLPPSLGKASDIGASDGNLLFGGGGGGGDGNKPFGRGGGGGGGDEDDMSIEGFRVLHGVVQWLRHLLGALKELLLADDFYSLISIFTKDNEEHAINPVGDEASSCDGKNDEEPSVDPIVLNSTTNSRRNYYDKNTRKETMRMRTTKSKSPSHSVDIGIPGDENDSDQTIAKAPGDENGSDEKEKKMKGRRGFVLNTAIASLAYSGVLIPYWTFFCSNANFGTWKDIIPTAHAVVTISSLILIGPASSFKEGELPDNLGFIVLQIMQLLILLWLSVATFIPLHVCRGISNLVVLPFASAVLCMILVTWINYFQPTEMVIKRIKTMFKKVTWWLRNLSLPECITAKFKKVRGTQRGQSQPMEMV